MSDGQVFYIVTVSGGQCLEKTSAGLVDKDASNSDAQRWTLEYGTNENTVAFQNVSNGQYLFASNGAAYGKIDTSIVKQWWTLEEGRSPGSCWIKCNDYPDSYLCNANGSYLNNNKVYSWPKQANWTHALTWVFKDANAPGFRPLASKEFRDGTQQSEHFRSREEARAKSEQEFQELEQKRSELDRKEQDLRTLEQELRDLQKKERDQRELEQGRRDLQKKEREVAAAEVEQKKQSEQLSTKERDLRQLSEQRLKVLESKEDAFAEYKKLADQQAELQGQRANLQSAERDLASRKAAAVKQGQKTIEAAEQQASIQKQIKKRLVELREKEVALQQKERAMTGNHSSAEDFEQLKAENATFRRQLQELLMKLSATQDSSPDTREMELVKAENARLKDAVAQLILQLNEAQTRQRPRKLAIGGSVTSNDSFEPSKYGSASLDGWAAGASAAKPTRQPSFDSGVGNSALGNITLAKQKSLSSIDRTKSTNNAKLNNQGSGTHDANKISNSKPNSKAPQKPAPQSTVDIPKKPPAKLGPGKQSATTNGRPIFENANNTTKSQVSQKTPGQHTDVLKKTGIAKIAPGALKRSSTLGAKPRVDRVAEGKDKREYGQVMHLPPRKLERKIVGIMYDK